MDIKYYGMDVITLSYLWDQLTVTTVLNTGETGDVYLNPGH